MPKQPIQLSDHFTYSRLVRFVLPCIGTMLFTSIYGIVDGLCVSNFVGKTAFAAVNLIMPLPMLIGTIGFMLGTGGSAIVGITLGEGNNKKADEFFSLFLIAALVAGIVFTVIGLLIIEPVAALLGAKGEMLDYALRYGRILLISPLPLRWARAAPIWCWTSFWSARSTGASRVRPSRPLSARSSAVCCQCFIL